MFGISRKSQVNETTGKRSAEALYDTHAPTLLGLCKRYCGNLEDAEDVLHDGFIKIIRNMSQFEDRNGGSFEGWMKRIMVNTALNHIRSKSKERMFLSLDDKLESTLQPEEEEEVFIEELAEKLKKEQIMEMVCALPAGYRTVFNLYVFESFSHREIAAELNCSENTSKSQLSKARAMLRRQLTQVMNKQIVAQ
jgi:RNA polymerase sigma-70 factor (ECF subfamily)